MLAQIKFPKEKIAEFCHRHHIRRLAVFGSALRDDFHSESDLDVLVEFEPRHIPGLAFFKMESELSQIVGLKVDLNTANFLSKDFRQQVVKEASVVYEEA